MSKHVCILLRRYQLNLNQGLPLETSRGNDGAKNKHKNWRNSSTHLKIVLHSTGKRILLRLWPSSTGSLHHNTASIMFDRWHGLLQIMVCFSCSPYSSLSLIWHKFILLFQNCAHCFWWPSLIWPFCSLVKPLVPAPCRKPSVFLFINAPPDSRPW